MRRVATLLAALALVACVSPLERGERLYREGDRLAALQTWRAIPEGHGERAEAEGRIAEVEAEFEDLVERDIRRGAYFEEHGRLAESILSYRLALELQPDDRETLQKVQVLSRDLARAKAEHHAAYEEAFAAGQLATARGHLASLRTLDPLDPDLAADEQALRQALGDAVETGIARGRRAFFAGEYASAARSFRGVLALDPDNEDAQGYLAYIATTRATERVSGRPPAAVDPPGFRASDAEIRAEGFYQNALAADRSGDPYTAIRYDLAAVASNPDHRAAREHMAAIRRRLQPHVDALIESGRTAFGREDLHTALDRWHRALLIDPDNGQARDYVDRAEKLLANLERLRAETPAGVSAR